MNAEFNWWLLIVGLVIGAGLVWLVLLDSRRREDEVTAAERAAEASWLVAELAEEGTGLSPAVVERVLDLHAVYLATSLPFDPAAAAATPSAAAPSVGGPADGGPGVGGPADGGEADPAR